MTPAERTQTDTSGVVRIRLTGQELRVGFDVALARQAHNLANGARHYYAGTHDALWQQTKGVIGEIAISLYLDRPLHAFLSLGDYDAPDVPPNVQVRCTGRAGNPLKLYKQKDHPDHPFVLAVWDTDKSLADVTLVGWAFKKEVAREAYWKPDPPPARGDSGCWNVPVAELRPMSELAALHAEARALEALERVAKYKQVVAARRPPTPVGDPVGDPFEDRDF